MNDRKLAGILIQLTSIVNELIEYVDVPKDSAIRLELKKLHDEWGWPQYTEEKE